MAESVSPIAGTDDPARLQGADLRDADPSHSGLPVRGLVLLALLAIFWGLNWPAMRVSLTAVPVWDYRLIGVLVGGSSVLAIASLGGRSLRVPRQQIGPLLLCSLFNIVGWNILTGYGLTLMEAGRSAIIGYTMPLWATLFSTLLVKEPLTLLKTAGLALGLVGLAVLLGGDLAGMAEAPLGAGFILLAALSWGFGVALLKRFRWSVSSATLAGWQLVAASPMILLGGWLFAGDGDWAGEWSGEQIVAFAYSVTIPMSFCFWAWYETVRLFPASVAAIGTLAIPLVGVFSGALLLGEPVGWRELTALLLVIGGLASVLLLPGRLGRPSR